MYRKPQKLAAEFWGTFAVVFASAGAVCANQFQRSSAQASSTHVAIGPVGIALAYGLAFAGMTAAVGRFSGGHFNPAISIGFWATRRLGTFDAFAYCVMQLGGATAAAYALRYAIPEATWRAVFLGTPDLAGGLTRGPAMLLEGLGAFLITFAVFAIAVGAGKPGGALAALAGGFAVIVGSLVAAPFTGGAMNPARAFGPAVAANHWTNHGIYWIGPLSGGVLAAWIGSLFSKSPK